MPSLTFADLPKYAAAVEREQLNRELSFLPVPLPICGVPIRHLNLRHFILLRGIGNKFVVGGIPSHIDVTAFLWFLSPDYSTTPGARELFVGTKLRSLDLTLALPAIRTYLDIVWQDAPSGSGSANALEKDYTCMPSSFVDILAAEYGWTDEHILELPLARLFLYLRERRIRRGKTAILFNPSDSVLGAELVERARGGTN